ncbi:hypothetical protein [Clostridium sp. B9]|uniref:hypothetical protein n=1 Tax=Clostridium sp. B9 TaxID=3423224 RepID=UPI003D2EF6B7
MQDIKRYKELRNKIEPEYVSIDLQGIYLFNSDEIEKAQVGYSITPEGESLVGKEAGDWKAEWLVIGYEDLIGDPIFIDCSNYDYPVFTAMHGEDEWNEIKISSSFLNFIESLKIVSEFASIMDELEGQELEKEKMRTLNKINEKDSWFWENWLDTECYSENN